MSFSFPPNLVGTATLTVDVTNTAIAVGSGGLPVFATPMLIALSEKAAFLAAQQHLSEPWTTVGTHLDFSHIAATPTGLKVTAEAKLVKHDKRTLEFEIVVKDEKEVVGKGKHTRAIVDSSKFLPRAEAKRSSL